MDQDLLSKAVNFHGPLFLQTLLGEQIIEPPNEFERERLQMFQFMKSRMETMMRLTDEPVKLIAEHSYPIIPIEMFQDVSHAERRDLFYKSLERGDILVLRVINDSLPDNYKLLVLCKPENHMKLDDLSITMYLPKLPAELELAGGEIQSNDIITAAVCSCSIDERKLNVTLDSNILDEGSEKVRLGKILQKDLPFYLGNIDVTPSYYDYLCKTTVFQNPNWTKDLQKIMCLKEKRLYSFFTELDGKTYDPVVYGTELKKKQSVANSNSNYFKGLHHYENENFREALFYFNKALSVNPKHADALVSRGILYYEIKKIRKSLKDMEAALAINPAHEKALKQMSILLVSVAKTHMEHYNLVKAKEALESALYVDSKNRDALESYAEFKKMNSSFTIRVSETPMQTSVSGTKDQGSSRSGSIEKSGGSSSKNNDTEKDNSKKDDSIKEQEALSNHTFDLQAVTKKFLSSMRQKTPEHEKDRASPHHRRPHHKSRSKSPKSYLPP